MRSRSIRIGKYSLWLAIALLSVVRTVSAAGPAASPAPEIDGASITAGLGLLTAGILILRARRTK